MDSDRLKYRETETQRDREKHIQICKLNTTLGYLSPPGWPYSIKEWKCLHLWPEVRTVLSFVLWTGLHIGLWIMALLYRSPWFTQDISLETGNQSEPGGWGSNCLLKFFGYKIWKVLPLPLGSLRCSFMTRGHKFVLDHFRLSEEKKGE